MLRILDKENAGIDLDALGMNPAMYALLREALSEPNGIILVTGLPARARRPACTPRCAC